MSCVLCSYCKAIVFSNPAADMVSVALECTVYMNCIGV